MTPAATLSAKAFDMLKRSPDLEYALAVDETSHPGQALVAVARRALGSCVIVMPAASWEPVKATRILQEALP